MPNRQTEQEILADLDRALDAFLHSWRLLRPGFRDAGDARHLNVSVCACMTDAGAEAARRIDLLEPKC